MVCDSRVLDVFVTKDSKNYSSGGFDDEFVCPVWSVSVDYISNAWTATVVNLPSNWVTACTTQTGAELEVGDLIRIGLVDTDGYTDYLTVLEKRVCTKLQNGCWMAGAGNRTDPDCFPALTFENTNDLAAATTPYAVENYMVVVPDHTTETFTPTSMAGIIVGMEVEFITTGTYPSNLSPGTKHAIKTVTPTTFTIADADGNLQVINNDGTGTLQIKWGTPNQDKSITPGAARAGSYVCYRVNFAISCTAPPNHWDSYAKGLSAANFEALENRHLATHSESYTEGAPDKALKQMFYPMYKVNKWLTNNGEISVALDHGVKALRWIKLVGYSCFNKRQVGFQAAHEQIADDWVALHINEVEGGVVSNNATANGAFCVLHVGGAKDNEVGAVEFHQHDPNGLFSHEFENHQSTIRNLNLKLLDRQGNAAHFGRIHLWFKICVQHG